MSDKTAELKVNSQKMTLTTHEATLGSPVIDVTKLFEKGYFTYDPGFLSTAACESKITYIDGQQGILLYRGYPVEQLAEKVNHLDVCYLLLEGELPTPQQKHAFSQAIAEHSHVSESLIRCIQGLPRDAHPMAMLISLLGILAAENLSTFDINNAEHRKNIAIDLIAKVPTLAALYYRHSQQQAFVDPQPEFTYAENFLHMMFHSPQQKVPNKILAAALDKIFILHADHEQNASTSTVRLAGSTGANPYACIAAGVTALWGPAHGGANEACLNMLKEIGDVHHIPQYIARAKDKNDSFRLMGFGHRVYKHYDPRAKVMRKYCHEVMQEIAGHDAPLFKVAMELEKIALQDNYFIEKKLYPNVDFYSGITLSALNFPTNMFTVIFAIGRTIGWIAQWHEMLSSNYRIGRPRQLYTGSLQRNL